MFTISVWWSVVFGNGDKQTFMAWLQKSKIYSKNPCYGKISVGVSWDFSMMLIRGFLLHWASLFFLLNNAPLGCTPKHVLGWLLMSEVYCYTWEKTTDINFEENKRKIWWMLVKSRKGYKGLRKKDLSETPF